jgi:hypothetical protein
MVTISTSYYQRGMPTLEYSIDIRGVRIQLSKEDFLALTIEIEERLNKDYVKCLNAKKEYDERVEIVSQMKKDILNCFYNADDDSFATIKTESEFDREKLNSFLSKYDDFLRLA